MVNLRKVSDETEESYTRFLRNATKEAKELGTTITELTEATATFARLGYNLADSTELGKIATMYSKVAENLSPEEASNSIISTMKAFKIGADEAERIVDEFNYVGEILPLHTVMYVDQMAISVNVRRRIRPR
jgi:TP901 family phage tail tape measure protein